MDTPDSQRVVPVEPTLVETITEKLTELLTGTYHCGRVWAAWGVGTMSADDFSPVEESDTPAEIAQAIVDMLAAAPAASPPVAPLAAAKEGVKPIPACWRYVHADPSNSSGWMDYDGDAELWGLRGKKAQANGLTIELAYSRPPAQTHDDAAITELRALYRAFVATLEAGRDRITSLGGDCDPVDVMEHRDPALIQARRFLATSPQPTPPASPEDRMDAERYRWLRRKVSAHGVIDGWAFGFPTHLSLPAPIEAMRDPSGALDAAIDAAREG